MNSEIIISDNDVNDHEKQCSRLRFIFCMYIVVRFSRFIDDSNFTEDTRYEHIGEASESHNLKSSQSQSSKQSPTTSKRNTANSKDNYRFEGNKPKLSVSIVTFVAISSILGHISNKGLRSSNL